MRLDRGTCALAFSASPAAGSRAGWFLSRCRPEASGRLFFGRSVHDLPHRRHTLGADAKDLRHLFRGGNRIADSMCTHDSIVDPARLIAPRIVPSLSPFNKSSWYRRQRERSMASSWLEESFFAAGINGNAKCFEYAPDDYESAGP
jgi:hypothetical protein